MLSAAMASVSLALAEDVVVVRSGQDGDGRVRRSGTIKTFTGKEIVLERSGGSLVNIPTDRVLEVLTDWPVSQLEGNRLLKAGQFGDALHQYYKAAKSDQRAWVRREALAQCVWCMRYLGDIPRAGETLLLIVQDDPDTQHLGVIPLAWWPQEPSRELELRSRSWLEHDTLRAARLMGASWLLSTGGRSDAVEVLTNLKHDQDSRIAALAEAQLWRTGIATATEPDLVRWRQMLQRHPANLFPGAYALLGRGWSRRGKHEQAALDFLRVPVLYGRHRRLAAQCLLVAGQELETINRSAQASRLYRELVQDYPESPSVGLARERLGQLSGS